jgi:hypothetical protein
MAEGHRHHQSFIAQHGAAHGGIIEADAAEADIDHPFLERGDLLDAAHFDQIEVDLGGGLAEFADQAGQARIHGRGDIADDEMPFLGQHGARHHRSRFVHFRQQLVGLIVEQPSGDGQAQRPFVAVEQNGAKLGLKLLDLAAERGLGDVQAFGGAGKIALIGDHDEVAKLAQIHDYTSGV